MSFVRTALVAALLVVGLAAGAGVATADHRHDHSHDKTVVRGDNDRVRVH